MSAEIEAARASTQDVAESLQRFGQLDYAVFVLMLASCAAIGVYYGFFAGQASAADYLVGGRSMSVFPVAMSLIASYISGISLLGTPTEIYVYGTQYMYILAGVVLMAALMGKAFLPVFHEMQLTSTYEYLEKRFDKKVRLFGSFLYWVAVLTWLPIVIYVPALAFNQVTGINVHVITPVVCVVCIFYTCVGGLRAVVWTDVVQTLLMFGAILLVAVKGTLDVGGLTTVWQRNYDSGRIEPPNFDADPMTRHTFWVLLFGGFAFWLQSNAVNQNQLQRYLSLPTLRNAISALWVFVVGVLALLCLCCYCGMLAYATYHDCDPLTTKLAKAPDQVVPLLVMRVLGDYPGMPGLFVAGVFSAALSSLSTGLNSMAAVVLEDVVKSFLGRRPSPRQTALIIKAVVLLLGVVCVALVFVVERLGPVLQVSKSLSGITDGASLGIFSMGLFLPWVNAKGALAGGAAGMVLVAWLSVGTQAHIASGQLSFDAKPVSVSGCSYDFDVGTPTDATVVDNTEVFALFRLSYMWYTLLGCLVSVMVSLVVSAVTQPTDLRTLDPSLVSPIIRRFLPRKVAVDSGCAFDLEKQDSAPSKVDSETR